MSDNRARTDKKETENRGRKFDVRTPYGSERRKLKLENTDPNFHYRFGIVDDPDRYGRASELESYGFTLCKGDDTVICKDAIREGGMIYVPAGKGGGKLALFKMPIEIKQYHDSIREKATMDNLKSRNSKDKNNSESLTLKFDSNDNL